MNERMNGRINEWTNEQINEWMNEWNGWTDAKMNKMSADISLVIFVIHQSYLHLALEAILLDDPSWEE